MSDSPVAEATDPRSLVEWLLARTEGLPGLRVPHLRPLRRQVSRAVRSWPSEEVLALVQLLLEEPDDVRRFFAYEIVNRHRRTLERIDLVTLESLGRGIDSWGVTDTFACLVAGPVWRQGQIADADVQRWASSDDRWWRRAALASTVPLNSKARGGAGDAPRTLRICRMLVADRDDMVVKALSWALRELAKRDPAAVRRFLSENASDLAPRVRREVTNKLTTGLKNPGKVSRAN